MNSYDCKGKGMVWFRRIQAETVEEALLKYFESFTIMQHMLLIIKFDNKIRNYKLTRKAGNIVIKELFDC